MKTISPEYAALNQQLHATCDNYGCKSKRHEQIVWRLMVKHGCNSLLDYGCGKGSLVKCFEDNHPAIPTQGFDPGHPDYLDPPRPADMVVCTDVMEHIEPELVQSVLKDIQINARKAGFFVIALRPDTSKLLPDGTNPHKVIQDIGDWLMDFNEAWGRKSHEITIHDYAPDKQITLSVKWV
jgi:hypothetical protein